MKWTIGKEILRLNKGPNTLGRDFDWRWKTGIWPVRQCYIWVKTSALHKHPRVLHVTPQKLHQNKNLNSLTSRVSGRISHLTAQSELLRLWEKWLSLWKNASTTLPGTACISHYNRISKWYILNLKLILEKKQKTHLVWHFDHVQKFRTKFCGTIVEKM